MRRQGRSWKEIARRLKTEVRALSLASRDPRVPWYARLLAICVVAYALSPIDLIPDPIPVLGYLDDLVLLPLGIAAVLKLIPPEVLAEHRTAAGERAATAGARNWVVAGVIVALWIGLASAAVVVVLWLR
jgi:uncharacterized membrane protein YkvA (DUF1232 family)